MVGKSAVSMFMHRVGASPAEEEQVRSLTWSIKRIDRHRDILLVGETPDYIFVILEGWAGRYSLRRNGSRRITGFMLPGDMCGINAVTESPMDHAITALTDCAMATVPKRFMEEAVASCPRIGKALWTAKLDDEAILRVWLRNSQDAERSLAHLICELHARLEAVGFVSGNAFDFPITQEHLGDALGITPVHTNRMLRVLRSEELIVLQRDRVVIENLDALRRSCGFDPSYLRLAAA